MLFCSFVLSENEGSSTSLGGNDVEDIVEDAAVVDEVIVTGDVSAPEVTTIEATVVAETTDDVTVAAETADDVTTTTEAVEEEVIATKITAERFVEESEEVVGAVTAGIIDGDKPTQGGSSKSGDHTDPALFDSSPTSKFYVRKARRGNVVSFDSERTLSTSIVLLTPRASQSESAGVTSMHVTPPTVVDALMGVLDVGNT